MSTNRIARTEQAAAVVVDEVADIIACVRLVKFEIRRLIEGRLGGDIRNITEAQEQLARLYQCLECDEQRLRRYFDLASGKETAVVGIPQPGPETIPAMN
jgi:hypothetical protein